MKIKGIDTGWFDSATDEYELSLTAKRLIAGEGSSAEGRFILLSELRDVREVSKTDAYGHLGSEPIAGRWARLRDNNKGLRNPNYDSGLVYVGLALNNDGSCKIGCTKFDAPTTTKILTAIFKEQPMTVYGAIASVVTRKVKAFISEVRAIVNTAKNEEKKLVATAEAEVKLILTQAKNRVRATEGYLKDEVAQLRNELVQKIEKL